MFRRALAGGDLAAVRAAASELPGVPLEDALAVSVLLLQREPDRYERAAVRWLGRLLLERPIGELRRAELGAIYLDELRHPTRAASAADALSTLAADAGVARAGQRLTEVWPASPLRARPSRGASR